MKTNKLLCALSSALLIGNLALAETDTAEKLDQIVVTASRTPLPLNQVGSALTVITRDQIEQREARHVTELLRSVPGFSVSHTGVVGSQTQVRVRGAEANHILVLIDGVRANDPATGDEFSWEYLSTGNIERIEVVRGPQSSLWGSDAVGAVVHIITRNGESGSSVDGYVEGGSFSTSNAGLNASIGSDNWSLVGSVERFDTDGENISRNGGEKDGSDLTTATLSARLAVNDSLTLDFGLRSTDAHSQFDPVDFFVTGLPEDGDRAADTENIYAHAGAMFEAPGGRISHHFRLNYFDSDNRDLTGGLETSSAASDRLTVAYQSDIDFGANRLSLALEHERTQFEQTGAIVFGDPNQAQEMDISSAVAEFQNLSRQRLGWTLSARLDDNSDFDNSVNGRFALTYQLSDVTKLRGSVGTGRKNPTFTERFGFFPGQFIGNASLKPERSTSYDVGLDQSMVDGALLVQLSLFQQDLKDEINGFVFDPVTFLSTAENIAGKSERSGAELGARWSVGESLAIAAHYTYTDATEQNVRELRRPRHSGGVSADYLSSNEIFSATLTADYGGNRIDIFFPPFPDSPEIVTLANYWLVDLAAQYRVTTSLSVFAKGTNLLDEDYEQVFGFRTLGRAGYLGVRINFGR